MTRFVLIRHGQTEWNRVERFRGRADLALDGTGVSQAETAAVRAAGWSASAIYSSPLRRALETAQVLSRRLAIPLYPLDGLIDIDFGSWQGLSTEEAAEDDQKLYRQWLEQPHLVCFPQGESLGEVRSRALASIEQVAARHGEQAVVLVSHKVVCHVLLCALLGLDNSHFWQVGQDVCAVNVFEIQNGVPVVTLVNDTCHLKSGA